MEHSDLQAQLALLKAQAEVELNRLKMQAPAKEVAGKAIGEGGLFYIALIIALGVGASVVLDSDKMAAVMGLLSVALTALISMLNGIAGTAPKQEKPEFEVIKSLIEKLDRLSVQEPMKVDIEGAKVTVTKGQDAITTQKE